MKLVNEFVVPLSVDDAWLLLTDVEKISGCMPGATLTDVNGNRFRGEIKIKVGPITALFAGKATLTKNERERKAIIHVDGSDTKGQGFAKGTITATLTASGSDSKVLFETDVTITGRMASFGRSVMSDISDKLFGQFVACVESDLLYG